MLVLSRKENEKVMIDTPDGVITITVVHYPTKTRALRLGFEAPSNYRINREEVRKAKLDSRAEL